jgi:mono/diheme cytochrome c family protein
MEKRLKTCALMCALFLVALAGATPRSSAARVQTAASQKVDYARDIAPLFEQACNSCHGAKKAAAQLRLDVKALALKGGMSGAVIVPGSSKDSRLLHRLLGLGGEKQMPLGGEALKPEQIELVRRWIDEGAAWPEDNQSQISNLKSQIPQHWAYVKPTPPTPPDVKDRAWVRNAIDRFVLARLEQEGLRPSPEAAKETLLRRVSLDLIGLPPSVKELDDFLADNSPDAYEKAVDRLLASPHYGERWARPWLDLARYADSHGHEKDRPRVMWKYRDWVINALNRDLPFDQFTVEQIAGDMLPNAGVEQLIATGFHRNTMLNQEGGVDDEEARWETIIDRVNTTGTVWLGSTIACAQCHNHKYDPFTQREYYKLFAFFDNHEYKILELGQGEGWVVEPELELPTPEQEARRKKLQDEINALEARLKADTPELRAARAAWEREVQDEPSRWQALEAAALKSTGGTTLTKLPDKSILASGAEPERDVYVFTAPLAPGTKITALRLEAMADASLPKGGPGRNPYGNFVLTGVEAEAAPAGNPAAARPLTFARALFDDAASRPDAKRFFASDDGPRADGWAIDATRDEKRLNRQAVFTLAAPLSVERPTLLTVRVKQLSDVMCQSIGRFRLSITSADGAERAVALPAKLRPLLGAPPGRRSEKQQAALDEQFRAITPLLKKERDRLRELKDSLRDLGIVTAQVMRERQAFERPSTLLRERGSYLAPAERVFAGVPAALHAWPEDQPFNRLGLARWLVSRENPLTSRVAVNRFWEQFFGRGIVETSEDFGSQGARPSHPELLDWLAVEFMERGWSTKHVHRLIVTSATYRQSSAASPALVERDPYNRLLARGPRFRMEAEMIRDTALAAGGLLNKKVGGPSVYPPQPDGIWQNPYDGANIKWTTSVGADRHRRSLYTFLRRTAPYPMLTTFDATSREFCTVRRVRTNTPLQALTTLNDEAAMEIARGLARRVMAEGGGDTESRLAYGFRLCVARRPNAAELERLAALYRKQFGFYQSNRPAAEKVTKGVREETNPAGLPEMAAWTIVANVLLNLDETMTKE